ncbi:Molybdenum cofactor biosynthesis protein MoaA [Fulvivirga imtechensis AK7]|uniref:GTP 3',8-cyclase n=1 Tax=Fulvivirga imtechensis AK7 TaxID=1237149 RepID=L8JRN6_9BACT|nr:GTP 3',8-cyclase MoaA [Fulvivirga imtechensis]ELR70027.1 Molybdenum cofactor biosynthesis protein MoaA [Fulvivirga imtechensis AK7]
MPNAQLTDNFGRPITYLRLAVTDRCNLRCFYCMPEEGINYLPKKELLTYEEMERLISVTSELGIKKVRITGGEPFVRRDMITFLEQLSKIPLLDELHVTTNGVFTAAYIEQLKAINISSVNLSLDTLDPDRFLAITRRDEFNKVMRTFNLLLEAGIPLKLNMVVMDGKNIEDILPMAELTRDLPVSVRFIEEMPFNGTGTYKALKWDHARILSTLKETYPDISKMEDPKNSTASHYKIPGASGNIGIIAAYTRTFCGSCNRIRVTSQGVLKTCLYDRGALDIKSLLRSSTSDEALKAELIRAINSRHKDGWAAEASRKDKKNHESMSTIGG